MTMRKLSALILYSLSLFAYAEQPTTHATKSTPPTIKKVANHVKQALTKSHSSVAKKKVTQATRKPQKSVAKTFASQPEVKRFILQMVKKHKFNQKKLVGLFNQVKFHQSVLDQIKRPLEKETWGLYQQLFVSEWRIQHGVKFWNKYADALKRAEKEYGVPASIIVATIGIETRYGKHTGGYRVIDSLSSLSFSDSKRAPFFRSELEHFLLLTREQKIDPLSVLGSYAGAIGQPQFMPSSYRHYAVNFSKSGKIDLMNDEIDVIGSIANYYSKHGWQHHQPIAIQAKTTNHHDETFLNDTTKKHYYKIHDLAKYGFLPKKSVKNSKEQVKVLQLDGSNTQEYWLSYQNFDVIKRYNASDLYAMAVFQLSEYISELRKMREHRQ